MTAVPGDFGPISSVIARACRGSVRASAWRRKVTTGAGICMCQLLRFNICHADISIRRSVVASPPLSILAAEWHDNVALRVLLKGLAEISISWSI